MCNHDIKMVVADNIVITYCTKCGKIFDTKSVTPQYIYYPMQDIYTSTYPIITCSDTYMNVGSVTAYTTK